MINISDEKWKSLPKFNDKLNERYGAPGTLRAMLSRRVPRRGTTPSC